MNKIGFSKRWRRAEQNNAQLDALHRLQTDLGLPPIVAALLAQRGLADTQSAQKFLRPALTDLHDPETLPGTTRAAERLARAVRDQQQIVIYGDYDVDGITATAILWHLLKLAGANVRTYVPHRIEEGYGLNDNAITELCQDRPLIVTVDCGITAPGPARIAKQAGVDLIITDHHEPDESDNAEQPDAYALVHPRLDGGRYPFPDLSGAGVAYKLGWQFARQHCGSQRVPDAFRAMLLDLLSYAALGTIADVVPLVGENRVMVTHGLKRIKHTPFPGLNALIEAAGLSGRDVDATHVGFVLGPRLNACGRMGHAEQAVRLLTEAQRPQAIDIAHRLTQVNDERRAMERQMFEQARQMAADAGCDTDDRRAIVLAHDDWHPGVVGIVASRMVEAFARPVILLCQDNGHARGSGRSVPGVSIHEVLTHCAEMFDDWGGHAMAAGLRIKRERVDQFRERFIKLVNERLDPSDMVGELTIDADCPIQDLTINAVEQIESLGPFGQGNPHPVLCAQALRVDGQVRRVGKQAQHLRIPLRQGNRGTTAVGFGMGELADQIHSGMLIDAAYEPKINHWNGRKSAEMHLKDIRPSDAPPP